MTYKAPLAIILNCPRAAGKEVILMEKSGVKKPLVLAAGVEMPIQVGGA
jgi:hypothetical protein